MGALWAEVVVHWDARSVGLASQIQGAEVSGGLNCATLHGHLGGTDNVAVDARGVQQVVATHDSGAVGHVDVGLAAQFLCIEERIIVQRSWRVQCSPHLTEVRATAAQSQVDEAGGDGVGGGGTTGERTDGGVKAWVVLSVEQGGGAGHGHAGQRAVAISLDGWLEALR